MLNDKHELYKMLEDGYEGCGGFLDGNYLTRHPREDGQKYEMRRRLAYYLNYLAPCVNAHVSPIFKNMAVRDWKGAGAELWQTFSDDVNFLGTEIQDLMKQAAYSAKLQGVAYIVMDRAQGGADDMRISDLEADRNNLPYAFVVNLNAVKEICLDRFGRITKFVFVEPDAYQEQSIATRTMTLEGWELDDSKGHHSGKWNLGMVPVIPLLSKLRKQHNPFPPSEFLSVAKTNLAIYNMCSWLSDILVNQTFSVLCFPSSEPDGINIGTNNALGYPPESNHAPAFIAPPDGPATVLATQIAALQQEIYRMAVVVNVTGSSKQQSGQAKAWDYEATNQILSDFADLVEAAEMKVAKLFSVWTGVPLEYSVNYPNDFKISEVEQELANAEIAKGLNFGDEFNLEVFKRVLTSYLPELKADDFDKLVKTYEEHLEQEKLDYNNTFGGDGEENDDGQAGGANNQT